MLRPVASVSFSFRFSLAGGYRLFLLYVRQQHRKQLRNLRVVSLSEWEELPPRDFKRERNRLGGDQSTHHQLWIHSSVLSHFSFSQLQPLDSTVDFLLETVRPKE